MMVHATIGLLVVSAAAGMPKTVSSVRLVLPSQASPTVESIGRVFARQVQQRCETKVTTSGEAGFVVELTIEPGIGPEGFQIIDGWSTAIISSGTDAVRIVGNDERGLLYGVGKFLRTCRYDQGGLTPGTWRGVSVPEKPVRGIYFATHFHNFYHEAPVEEVKRYVEDLGLWGFNTIVVWYDMYHFRGFTDPEAAEFRQRLRAIFKAARGIGLSTGLGTVANEAYGNSPQQFRADISGMRGAIRPTDICPNKPGARQYLLENFARLFDALAGLGLEYVWIWPYDSGGCGCQQCAPWGNNGFLSMAEPVSRLARRSFPGVKIVLSTWYMTPDEWQGLREAFEPRPGWVDYILAENFSGTGVPLTTEVPGGLSVVGFPEISMHGMWPWGGFGATPLPRRFQGQWNAVKDHIDGGFPYSEGIYDDINKVLFTQFYWSDRSAEETLREYIAFEYSPDVVDDVLKVIATLEQNHHMRWWPGELDGVKLTQDWFPSRGAKPQADPGAEEAYATVQQVEAKLSPPARQSWRWRQLLLRTKLDAELKKNGGLPNDRCQQAFAELIEIYYAQNADPGVRPPLDPDFLPQR